MTSEPRTWAKPLPNAWYICAQAGMTLTEAAAHLGKSRSAGSCYAKRHGFSFQVDMEARAKHLRRLTSDPEINVRRAASLKANDEWREASAQRMRDMNAKRDIRLKLTEEERADYDELTKRHRYRRAEALRAVGRADLVQP